MMGDTEAIHIFTKTKLQFGNKKHIEARDVLRKFRRGTIIFSILQREVAKAFGFVLK